MNSNEQKDVSFDERAFAILAATVPSKQLSMAKTLSLLLTVMPLDMHTFFVSKIQPAVLSSGGSGYYRKYQTLISAATKLLTGERFPEVKNGQGGVQITIN